MEKKFRSGIAIGLIPAVILGIFGYFIIVKTNEVKIEKLTSEIQTMNAQIKEAGDVMNATRIFITKAHPNKHLARIFELDFLGKLSNQQVSRMVKTFHTLPKSQWSAILVSDSSLSKEEFEKLMVTFSSR